MVYPFAVFISKALFFALNILDVILKVSFPDTRRTAMAELPGGVARAQMVCEVLSWSMGSLFIANIIKYGSGCEGRGTGKVLRDEISASHLRRVNRHAGY
jgi:hypothetical protein